MKYREIFSIVNVRSSIDRDTKMAVSLSSSTYVVPFISVFSVCIAYQNEGSTYVHMSVIHIILVWKFKTKVNIFQKCVALYIRMYHSL